jgi:hypothetical protein
MVVMGRRLRYLLTASSLIASLPATAGAAPAQTFPFISILYIFLHTSVADPPWHFGVDPDSAIFDIDLQANKKLTKKFFCILLLKDIYTIFKDKQSKRSHKTTVEIKGFLTIFA